MVIALKDGLFGTGGVEAGVKVLLRLFSFVLFVVKATITTFTLLFLLDYYRTLQSSSFSEETCFVNTRLTILCRKMNMLFTSFGVVVWSKRYFYFVRVFVDEVEGVIVFGAVDVG